MELTVDTGTEHNLAHSNIMEFSTQQYNVQPH